MWEQGVAEGLVAVENGKRKEWEYVTDDGITLKMEFMETDRQGFNVYL